MRRTKGGKQYDTETAKLIFKTHIQTRVSKWVEHPGTEEGLYRSPLGKLFLANEEGIELKEANEAQDWLDKHDAPTSAYRDAGITPEKG